MKVTKEHRRVSFKHKPWFKPHISWNTKNRAATDNQLLKKFKKLFVNAFNGKTTGNVGNGLHLTYVISEDTKNLYKQQMEARFTPFKILGDFHFLALEIRVTFRNPIFQGICVLEISKLHKHETY